MKLHFKPKSIWAFSWSDRIREGRSNTTWSGGEVYTNYNVCLIKDLTRKGVNTFD